MNKAFLIITTAVLSSFAFCGSWRNEDIGSGIKPGKTKISDGEFTLSGAGNGPDGVSSGDKDAMHFCFQEVEGNVEITAKINAPAGENPFNRAGLMIRESEDESSNFISVSADKNGTIRYHFRNGVGMPRSGLHPTGIPKSVGYPKFPVWIRLTRYEDALGFQYSWDGENWWNRVYSGGLTIRNLNTTLSIGMFVASGKDDELSQAVFENVEVKPLNLKADTFQVGNSHSGWDYSSYAIKSIAVTPEGTCFVAAEDENKREAIGFDSNGNFCFEAFEGNQNNPETVAVNEKYIFYGLRKGGLRRFEPDSGWRKNKKPLLKEYVFEDLAVDEKHNLLYGVCEDAVRIFNAETLEPLGTIELSHAAAAAVLNGKGVCMIRKAVGENPPSVWFYETSRKKLSETFKLNQFDENIEPSSIAVSPSGNRIFIADKGRLQQIHIFDESGKYISSFGQKYGVLGSRRGIMTDDALSNPLSIGFDGEGNLYVACRGLKYEGTFQLKKFNKNGNLEWFRYGLEWVDAGDFDPETLTDVYTSNHHYKVDTQTGKSSFYASTFDPYNYPDDPRGYLRMGDMASVFVRRIEGKRFLFMIGMTNKRFVVYRFEPDSEIAVPCAWIETFPPKNGPPKAPRKSWIWVDHNGDGQINDGFEKATLSKSHLDGMFVTVAGDILISNQNKITRLVCDGLNQHGVPLYSADNMIQKQLTSEITSVNKIKYIHYDSERDSMIIAGYSEKDPRNKDEDHFGDVGRDFSRIDNWSTEPVSVWSKKLITFGRGSNNHDSFNIASMSAAGEYIFSIIKSGKRIDVYSRETGNHVDTLYAGPEITGYTGIIDIMTGLKAHYRKAENDYLLIFEEDARAKNCIMRWKPEEKN